MMTEVLRSAFCLAVLAVLALWMGSGIGRADGAGGAAATIEVAAALPRPKPEPADRSATKQRATPAVAPSANRENSFLKGIFGRRDTGNAQQVALLRAYPNAFRIDGNTVVFTSGARVVWDDGLKKDAQTLLKNADVEDMFAYPYAPARLGDRRPPRLHDPGRVRNDAFFKALYGGSADAVRGDLTSISWVPRLGGGTVAVTTRFGVHKQLAAVSAELERLPQQFHKYIRPSAGTFLWRRIAGTNRQSVHSFGAAIDINTHFANYWRWDEQPSNGTILFRNEVPMEIVSIFEKYCFIWGGRWYHYDTMHFEYRPELLPNCQK